MNLGVTKYTAFWVEHASELDTVSSIVEAYNQIERDKKVDGYEDTVKISAQIIGTANPTSNKQLMCTIWMGFNIMHTNSWASTNYNQLVYGAAIIVASRAHHTVSSKECSL